MFFADWLERSWPRRSARRVDGDAERQPDGGKFSMTTATSDVAPVDDTVPEMEMCARKSHSTENTAVYLGATPNASQKRSQRTGLLQLSYLVNLVLFIFNSRVDNYLWGA